MIRIDFSEPATEEWKTWRAKCEKKTGELIRAYERGEKPKVTTLYATQKPFYIDRSGPFHGKCAYCETSLYSQYGDMEHFRPKGKIVDENGETVLVENGQGTEEPHPGYYWLAYDFRNLLPSCIRCNQIQKKCCFPVRGDHAARPGDEVNEDPLLLHPVFDNPAEYLELDPTGVFMPREDSEKLMKADMTISVFDLNHEGLVDDRQNVYKATIKSLMTAMLIASEKGDRELTELETEITKIKDGVCSFSAAARRALEDIKGLWQRGADLSEPQNLQ